MESEAALSVQLKAWTEVRADGWYGTLPGECPGKPSAALSRAVRKLCWSVQCVCQVSEVPGDLQTYSAMLCPTCSHGPVLSFMVKMLPTFKHKVYFMQKSGDLHKNPSLKVQRLLASWKLETLCYPGDVTLLMWDIYSSVCCSPHHSLVFLVLTAKLLLPFINFRLGWLYWFT